MAQHDYVIDNAAGATVRADMNNLYQAIAEINSGALEPSTKFPYMFWADTTANLLKQRNGGNTAWVIRDALGTTRVLPKTVGYTVALDDFGSIINCTGTFTLAFTAAATLGANFKFHVKNSGTGVITLDPNAAETIDGVTTITVQPGEEFTVFCDGSAFITAGKSNILQIATFIDGTVASGGGVIPADNTIPTSIDGSTFMTFVFTPRSASSILYIEANAVLSNRFGFSNSKMTMALFKDSDAAAMAATMHSYQSGEIMQLKILHKLASVSVSPITFKVRAGGQSPALTTTLNGTNDGISDSQLMGGAMNSYIMITESLR